MLFAPLTFDLAHAVDLIPSQAPSDPDLITLNRNRNVKPFRSVTHLVLTFQAEAWARTPEIRGQ